MSGNIDEILTRADLQVIRGLLIDGIGDENSIDKRPYRQRLDEDCAAMYRRIEAAYPDDNERDAAFEDIFSSTAAHQEVFFELGMKCGARLLHQLLAE